MFSTTNDQSEFLVQLDITINRTYQLKYALETNVGMDGADPCAGDSGGPLLLKEADKKWTIIGSLIGGGLDCKTPSDRSDNTSDWTKIPSLVPWIHTIVDKKTPVSSCGTSSPEVSPGKAARPGEFPWT